MPAVEPRDDDWWLIGLIVDAIVDVEIEVLCRPPRLGMREKHRPTSDPGAPSFIAGDATPMGPARYWQKPPPPSEAGDER